uniref:NOP2/Sun RNA methyltransferase family member 7 n=1 Tax=Lepisosteus oculatus TaxID=7918 RepID=W5N5Q3_LEPOC|nr:PREDICTED: putative methyltransferase NSUN7 [Lepisosteus oculatus]XP_015201467.1 PREDICTED: putative methyltransferase NSUN7 [Lepisosteus oculatus]
MEPRSQSPEIGAEISSFGDLSISHKVDPSKKSPAVSAESGGYPDYVYVHAAAIFFTIHVEKPVDRRLVRYGDQISFSVPEAKNEIAQHYAHELAFNALKYQDLLEDIMIDSCFYLSQSIPDDLTSLVVVMLYDFQDRKFLPRACPEEEEIEEVRDVEKCLLRYRTKLAAALARCRIKHNLLTIDYILPESVRKKQERASTLPLYAWVNTMKTSLEDVCCTLEKEGFSEVKSISQLGGLTFCLDPHCQDLLVFPPHLKADLYRTKLLTEYKLIIQDKSRSLAAHSVKALLTDDDDVIMANLTSGYTIAHMAALSTLSTGRVWVCGVSQAREELQEILSHMECKNVKLLPESFTDIEPTDPRLQKAKVILVMPQCSATGVSNPVEFILNDSGDAGLLQDLCQGSISEDKLNTLVRQQLQDLIHAVKFPKAQAVVYCTCSVHPEENEGVVRKALLFKPEGTKAQPYRLSPPVLPLCCMSEVDNARENYFRLGPCERANGCFIAVLTREDSSQTVTVKDVLARAAAKGLLEGIDTGKPAKKERRKAKASVLPSSSASASQARIAEFLSRERKTTSSSSSLLLPAKACTSSHALLRAGQRARTPKPTPSSLPAKKNGSKPPPAGRPPERRAHPPRARPEERASALKPVELVLPPVMFPGCGQSRSPLPLSFFRWKGTSGHSQTSLSPSSLSVSRHREALRSGVVLHPRPWL